MNKNTIGKAYYMEDLIEKFAAKNRDEYGEAKPDAVIGKVFASNPDLKQQANQVITKTEDICASINQASDKKLQHMLESYEYETDEDEGGLPDLPNADQAEGVVMRMAPFPSGMLHIGNARMAILNDEYVKRYGGTLYLVIDDTAGSEEKKPIQEAYEQIPKDLDWLGVEYDTIVYKSDRLETFYDYAELFLQNNWAYVCTCSIEALRKNRKKGIECSHREQSADKNLSLWKDMLEGGFDQGEAAVRLKTDMKADDPAFRDRVLLRIADIQHPRVGKEYQVWPMLEFSWAIDDHELGMTHIIRGNDLAMEDKMERYMWNLLDWPEPEITHHGMLQFEGITLSTSDSKQKIDSGEYTGWEDPRTWSLQSLRKRGFKPEAIRTFILSFGMSDNSITTPVDALYTENRRLIDEEADRYFFIENPERITVSGLENEITANLDRHPEFPDRGQRTITVSPSDGEVTVLLPSSDVESGKEIRLKDLCNVKIEENGAAHVTEGGLPKARNENLQIVQWLPQNNHKECSIIHPDGRRTNGICESNLKAEDQVIQFIRYGFCRIEAVEGETVLCYFTHQ